MNIYQRRGDSSTNLQGACSLSLTDVSSLRLFREQYAPIITSRGSLLDTEGSTNQPRISRVASSPRLIYCTYRRLEVIFSLVLALIARLFATVKTDCGDACSEFLARTFPMELARNPLLISNPKHAMLEVWDALEEKFYGICVQVSLTHPWFCSPLVIHFDVTREHFPTWTRYLVSEGELSRFTEHRCLSVEEVCDGV